MRYYELKQDRRLRNLIEIKGFKGCPDIVMDREAADTFKRCSNMYVTGNKESQYPDLFQSPVLMVSEKLYQILKYYDTDVIYKIVVLTDKKMHRQEVYRLMMPRIFEVPVRNELKNRIFYVKEELSHHLIVTEDVLESILARQSIGVSYKQVDLKEWGKEK